MVRVHFLKETDKELEETDKDGAFGRLASGFPFGKETHLPHGERGRDVASAFWPIKVGMVSGIPDVLHPHLRVVLLPLLATPSREPTQP